VIYREAIRRLKALGCVEVLRRGGGSHRKWRNLTNGRTTVLPDRQGKDIKPGTLRAAVGQLGLDWTEFEQV
jgi:predicted RNA binding protein YcfA (HicA-like mRNA interferase family)